MDGLCLGFPNPIGDAISAVRFAPQSNNLLISSWDSSLRLYDVDRSLLRLEAHSDAALLDCCFQDDPVAFSAASDGFIRRYDLHSGSVDTIGNHDDIATCVQYSVETSQVFTAGLDNKIMSLDMRMGTTPAFWRNLDAEVESMSLSGFDLIVATGASVNLYDLRNLNISSQSCESQMDVQIKCVSSISYSRGYIIGSIDGRVAVEVLNSSDSNNMRYTFRCHPKTKDGRYYLVPVNDIVFNPKICGAFVSGDNEGYVIAWDAQRKKRLYELPRYPNSVASLSYNYEGQLLAVASSYMYQQATEKEEPPQIFVHKIDEFHQKSVAIGSSTKK